MLTLQFIRSSNVDKWMVWGYVYYVQLQCLFFLINCMGFCWSKKANASVLKELSAEMLKRYFQNTESYQHNYKLTERTKMLYFASVNSVIQCFRMHSSQN